MSTTEVNSSLLQVTRWRLVNAFLVREEDGSNHGLVRNPGPTMDNAIASAGG